MPKFGAPASVVKSADRVLDILELLASSGRLMTHGEIARRLDVPKSSLTQLLRNLAARGYVEVSSDGGSFCLGDSAVALGRQGIRIREMLVVAQPAIENLTRQTGESSAFTLLRDNMAERVCSAHSDQEVLYAMHVGVRAPLYAHSAGKVFLAWMHPSEREAYFRTTTLHPLTPKTLRSVSSLRKELVAVKNDGVGYSHGEFTLGVVGISVPVFDIHRRLIAAVGMALPEERYDDVRGEALVAALRDCSAEINKRLGES